MAQLSEEDVEILREALRFCRKSEPFESAVGKAVRKRDLDFGEYIRIMGELRELAHSRKVSVREAVKSLIESGE